MASAFLAGVLSPVFQFVENKKPIFGAFIVAHLDCQDLLLQKCTQAIIKCKKNISSSPKTKEVPFSGTSLFFCIEASGTRTPDNLIKSQVLYHLS